MSNLGFRALETAINRQYKKSELPSRKISEYFGELTFNQSSMREYLPMEAFNAVQDAISHGAQIDRRVADQVAAAMKAWAINKGATHYTHWFHPLTGATAEKHDAFVSPQEGGTAIENFRGNQLVQQEPDASSFPSGGIRNTFEARGYTAWDPTSPAFIMDSTLCIPTVFVSYTGEALDFKTPLLKVLSALDREATQVCRFFNPEVNKVVATLGWEQEYFVVDHALFSVRADLELTGRTVFGHASAKDQQLSDHYFGSIPERIMNFLREFEYECHRLGIPIKTRHNEVAPNQFECAPVFEEVNLAVDHNMLVMHLLKKISKRHDLTVLLHEKPFSRINGSGKHNNWSLLTDTGINLLTPGKTENENLRFLAFLSCILKGIYIHNDLLRASIASYENEWRLGAHEAPPAIISVFVGTELTKSIMGILNTGQINTSNGDDQNLFVPKIPEILLDNTDRNRTSPFAFTGNKFEFRAVGSSLTCAKPMTALNLIVSGQLKQFYSDVELLVNNNMTLQEAILQTIKSYLSVSIDVLFEGNNYSDEWKAEAEKRGLKNIGSTPVAVRTAFTEETIKLYESLKVLTRRELYARHEIKMEKFAKKIQIEARVIGDLATNHIIPIALKYQNVLIENVKGLRDVLDSKTFVKLSKNQLQSIKEISEHVSEIKSLIQAMILKKEVVNGIDDLEEKAMLYAGEILPFFDQIRVHVDQLEMLVDDELWPLPKYRELLFIR